MFYVLKGKEPVLVDYDEWLLSRKIKTIEETVFFGGKIWTLFLGLDHNISGVGAPELFETIILGGVLDGKQFIYATWDQAIKGHQYLIKENLRQNLQLN